MNFVPDHYHHRRDSSSPRAVAVSAGEDAGRDQTSRRVKLLCSYGGRILPRPSDGALRYAGGDTRIVSVRRDVRLPELMRRVQEVFGAAAVLKYQLPDEEMDALVSVSSDEDLENMMEEYDKLAASGPDGAAAKLRTFLFGLSDSVDDLQQLDDTGQLYIEAVNGIARKDSITSASSTQNSDAGTGHGGETPDCAAASSGMEGTSSELQSTPSAAESIAQISCTSAPQDLQFSWTDPLQMQFMNQQERPLMLHGGAQSLNAVGIPVQASTPASVRLLQERLDSGAVDMMSRAVVTPSDQNVKPQPPLSKLPPLPTPPLYLQQQILPPPPPFQQPQGQGLWSEDCYMSQKVLPHAYSDTLVQDKGITSPSGGVPTAANVGVFHSLHSEDLTRQKPIHRVVVAPFSENVVEPKVESSMPRSQVGAYGYAQAPESQYSGIGERQVPPKLDNFDHARVLQPISVMSLQGDQAFHGMVMSTVPSVVQPLGQTNMPPQYIIKPDSSTRQPIVDVNSSRNANFQVTEALNRDPYLRSPYEFIRPVDETMDSLRTNPTEAPKILEPAKSTMAASQIISKEFRPEVPLQPQVLENGQQFGEQLGGNPVYVGNPFINTGVVLDANSAHVQSSIFDASFYRSFQTVDAMQAPTVVENRIPYNVEAVIQPPIPNERLLGFPSNSSNIVSNAALGDWKDELSLVHLTSLQDHVSTHLSSNAAAHFLNTESRINRPEQFLEPTPSDPFVHTQDAQKVVGSTTHSFPPRPSRVTGKEVQAVKDSGTVNLLGHRNDSNVASLMEEGALYHPYDSLIKEPQQETIASTRGSAEEQIKMDLQALAEGVASSVLQSSSPLTSLVNVPGSFAQEILQPISDSNKASGVVHGSVELENSAVVIDEKHEEINVRQMDRGIFTFQITEDIGRLQIIKNSDLEELRELGSGTFGTVYHGKWRGSDVAIKRINDRCFAGKPSEQERLRADFWNEASKLADLHHPNVVAFYGVVLDGPGGSVATVTEYMVNGSLRHALQRNDKAFDRRKRLLIAMDVAFGMEYLHGKNIVHFDLKSDNLLVNLRDPQRPICKVGDLGLSKVKCQTLISGGVRGTLPWMAPELLNGSSSLVSEKVDVFSFGIVMWELLTGEEPYADLHYGAIIGGIVSNTLRPSVPENCDPEWSSLMEQCWSSEPSERPSFTEIAGRLRSMAASLPQKGHPQGH